MCEIIFFGLLGNVEIVELLRNIGIVAFIASWLCEKINK